VTEPLRFDWDKTVARGPSGWINALAARPGGVVVVGADASKSGQGEPFVASLDGDGRERFRVKLGEPRSTLARPRAVAVVAAATAADEVYVVSIAVRSAAPTAVGLTLLDASGRARFSIPLELSAQVAPSLVVEPNGDVFVGGWLPSGSEFAVSKVSHDGTRSWTKTYPLAGSALRLLRFGEGLVLVGSLSGRLEFGASSLARTETIEYRCAGDDRPCADPATSLFLAELGPAGEPLRARLLGSASSRLSLSDATVSGDRLVVTGEYSGPPTALGTAALCELEPGMPELEAPGAFREMGEAPRCACRRDRRDLFLLSLDARAEPRWAKTLAVGAQAPLLAAGDGELRWAANLWRNTAAAGGRPNGNGELALWSLDAEGSVRVRRGVPGSVRQMVATPGAVYLSDQRRVRKTQW
jgi:hypothetical protein